MRRFLGIAGDIVEVVIVWTVILAAIMAVIYGCVKLWTLIMA